MVGCICCVCSADGKDILKNAACLLGGEEEEATRIRRPAFSGN
jgi:hypothetical protein